MDHQLLNIVDDNCSAETEFQWSKIKGVNQILNAYLNTLVKKRINWECD